MKVLNNPNDIPGDPQPESRFFQPDARCPHPERWTAPDGDSTECEVSEFIGGLVRGLQPDYVIETGSAFGFTTLRIAAALIRNGHGKLIAIEPDEERAQITRERLAQLTPPNTRLECVDVYECSSLDVQLDKGTVIDLAFFDSWYELRVPEFHHFRQWMRSGTICCFHDSAPGHGAHRIPSGRDLMSEVNYELGGEVRWINLPTPRGLLIAEVL